VNTYEGWEQRTVFVANTGVAASTFTVGFQGAVTLAAS